MECLETPPTFGAITEIVPDSEGEAVYLGTLSGHILKYSVTVVEPGKAVHFKLEDEWKVSDGGIRRLLLLKPRGGILVATLEEELWFVSARDNAMWAVEVVDLEEEEEEEEEPKSSSERNLPGMVSCMAWDGKQGHLFVGNDDGDVYWFKLSPDSKKVEMVKSFDHHDDLISCMELVPAKKTLLVGSGDGSLSVIDLKKGKLIATSKNFDDEVTCMTVLPKASKILLGMGLGDIKVFKWNYWGSPCEALHHRYHNMEAISDMVLLDEEKSLLLTVAGNGAIRIVPARPLKRGIEVSSDGKLFEKVACLKHTSGNTIIFAFAACDSHLFHRVIDEELLEKVQEPISEASPSEDDSSDNLDSGSEDETHDIAVRPTKRPKAKQPKIHAKRQFFNDLD